MNQAQVESNTMKASIFIVALAPFLVCPSATADRLDGGGLSFTAAVAATQAAPHLDAASFAGATVRYEFREDYFHEVDVGDALFAAVAGKVGSATARLDAFHAVCRPHRIAPEGTPPPRDARGSQPPVHTVVRCEAELTVMINGKAQSSRADIEVGKVPGPKSTVIKHARMTVEAAVANL